MLKLIAIKTEDCIFISDNITNNRYNGTVLENYKYENDELIPTFKKNWYKLKEIPSKIYKINKGEIINSRYELKKGYPSTEKTPSIIYNSEDYESVLGLYNYKYDKLDDSLSEIEFEINIIHEVEGVFEFADIKYELNYDFLSQLNMHPDLLELSPCEMTTVDSYNLVRKHIKENINNKYASITSDYDFCLTVKKYAVSSNNKLKKQNQYEVYRTSPKGYDTYPIIKKFKGKNYKDLQKNINDFLNELMSMINEPIKLCECCNGNGVIK